MNRYPIIYIRGYAMRLSERDETAADPFCGFNTGSTLFRAPGSKSLPIKKMVFESPVVRLINDFGYKHVYQNGQDMTEDTWEPEQDDRGLLPKGIPPASIIIFRYYDDGSSFFGDGKSRNIVEYAQRLNELILNVRRHVARYSVEGNRVMPEEQFRCYLVSHSMGGLVARAFLQGQGNYQEARKTIDKFFTFATPHNGIDTLGVNVPHWLTKGQMNTFNRTYMAKYLQLDKIAPYQEGRVDIIPEKALAPSRIFCLVGTNRNDYEAALGLARTFVGHGSDGLVRIDNASLWGFKQDESGKPISDSETQVATAYIFRAHSGPLGIVNSEEAYQNLTRFLFGDVRVDITLEIEEVWLPCEVQALIDSGKTLEALYQFEFSAAPKGKPWYLTRRNSIEDSPACRGHSELVDKHSKKRKIYLSSVFLSKWAKVDNSPMLSYAMALSAKTPDYIIDRRFIPNIHFEGSNLFQGMAIVELTPPSAIDSQKKWNIKVKWDTSDAEPIDIDLEFSNTENTLKVKIPFCRKAQPGIKGSINLDIQPWE